MSNSSQIVTYLFTILAFISTILIAILGALNGASIGGIFKHSVGNLSDKYYLELTPSGYVFGTIWPINFLWTIAGKCYLVASLFFPADKSPVKMNPALTPLAYLVFDTLSFGFTNSWYFSFDAQSLGWSYTILILTVANIYVAIGITLKRVAENAALMEKNKATFWLVRILLQNGLCTFATWVTIASMLGLTMILVYVDSADYPVAIERGLISDTNASSVSAGILLGLVIVWFILENLVLEKYLRYMFTIYPVLIFAFSGVITKLVKTGGSRQNIIIASVNISVCTVLFIARIVLSVYKFKRRKNNDFKKEKLNFEQI